jgi:xylan 1,4-beta-xylosidase
MEREQNKSVPLGRETGLQKMRWDSDGWPRLAAADNAPQELVEVNLPECRWPVRPTRDDFDGPVLDPDFQTLREPAEECWCSLTRRPGWLSLRGRDSLASCFDQSLVARRLQHFRAYAETCMTFQPENFKQAAGLIAYYDRMHYHYFRVTGAAQGQIKLGVISSEYDTMRCHEAEILPISAGERLFLRMGMDRTELRFWWSPDGSGWNQVDRVFDATMLGDWVSPLSNFTGTFWGVCCQDLATRSAWAHFDYFDYVPEGRGDQR